MVKVPAFAAPNGTGFFHVAYASRATGPEGRTALSALIGAAARQNVQHSISGVMLQSGGVFLQWIEGPGHEVCALMARIADDPRHTDITVLNSGWLGARRFGNWPMQMGACPLDPALLQARSPARGMPCHPGLAEIAFDDLADSHRRQGLDNGAACLCDACFVDDLIHPSATGLPKVPQAACHTLQTRAALIDDTCDQMGEGWHEGRWSAFEITLGLAGLNRLWQRGGRICDPARATDEVCVVVPPGSAEMIGAIVKTDLFRAAGISVRLLLEKTDAALCAALTRHAGSPVLVVGPRIGLNGDHARAEHLTRMLQARFPKRAIYLGGRLPDPAPALAEPLTLNGATAGVLKSGGVEWLAMAAIAKLAHSRGLH